MKRVENGPMFYPEAKAMVDADVSQSQLQAAIAASLEGMDIDVNEAEDWKLRVATFGDLKCIFGDGSIFKLIDIYIYIYTLDSEQHIDLSKNHGLEHQFPLNHTLDPILVFQGVDS